MTKRFFNHGLHGWPALTLGPILYFFCCFKRLIVLLMFLLSFSADATTWYVTKNGSDSNSGKSVSSSFLTIQKAVNSAIKGDEIRVSSGTYDYITVSANKEPLAIRAVGTVSGCVIKGASGHRCVTIGSGATTNVFIIGFTLTGASLSGENYGAGVYGGTCSNCVIRNNTAATYAGGAYCSVLIDCTIKNNSASYGVGGISKCKCVRCTIASNTAKRYEQGGVTGSDLEDCVVELNVGNAGGGVADSILRRCIVRNNKRLCGGDGAYGGTASQGYGTHNSVCYDSLVCGNSGPDGGAINGGTFYNCTIVENTGRYHITDGYYDVIRGGAFYNCIFGGKSTNASSNTVTGASFNNCLLWNVHEGKNVTKKTVKTGNPSFVGISDFRLQSTSSCVDGGNNSFVKSSFDISGKNRIYNGTVDIGAYEYQPAEPMVSSVMARQRYPWNGMVDISFTITGDAGTAYRTTFAAKDVAGGTNLVMETVWEDGKAAASSKPPYQLTPGNYRFVWNAGADLPDGTKLERVAITVEAK